MSNSESRSSTRTRLPSNSTSGHSHTIPIPIFHYDTRDNENVAQRISTSTYNSSCSVTSPMPQSLNFSATPSYLQPHLPSVDSNCAPTGGSMSSHTNSIRSTRVSSLQVHPPPSSQTQTQTPSQRSSSSSSSSLVCGDIMDLASSSTISPTQTALSARVPLLTPMKRTDGDDVGDEDDEVDEHFVGGEEDEPMLDGSCHDSASSPPTSRSEWHPIRLILPSLPDACIPTTVTQHMPTTGMLEWYVPLDGISVPLENVSARSGHESDRVAYSLSPIFISHGQIFQLALTQSSARSSPSPSPSSSSSVRDYSLCLILHAPPTPPQQIEKTPTPTPTSNAPPASNNSTPAPPPNPNIHNHPFRCTATGASGILGLRPEVRCTIVHPSGEDQRNINLQTNYHTHHQHHRHHHESTLSSVGAFLIPSSMSSSDDDPNGLSIFIGTRDSLQPFTDDAGCMLIRVSVNDISQYVWTLSTTLMASLPLPLPQHPSRSTTVSSQASVAISSASLSSTSLTLRMTRESSIPTSIYATGVSTRRSASTNLVAHSSSSASSSTLTTLNRPSSLPPLIESTHTSSHMLFQSYEFFLRLKSDSSLGRMREQSLALALVLHPRHLYRLREDLSLRVEAEVTFACANHRHGGSRAPNAWRLIGLFHATTPEAEWSVGQDILQQMKEDIRQGWTQVPSSTNPSSASVSASSLRAHISFHSLGVVWSLKDFTSLGTGRRTSNMFRLNDLTWNLIVDPKGNGEPGYLSIYLALDKTSAGVFCHGLTLLPTFTLAVLHSSASDQHIVRRFEDAVFSYERASWGCTCFIDLATLQNGYITPNGCLQVELQIHSICVNRPTELSVDTKVGPFSHFQRHHSPTYYTNEYYVDQGNSRHQVRLTASSPEIGDSNSLPSHHRPHSLHLQSHQRHVSIPSVTTTSSSSDRSSASPPRFCCVNSPLIGSSSSSPPLPSSSSMTPMTDYLGAEMNDDEDAYELSVQKRRFGGNSFFTTPSFSPNIQPDGRTNSSFLKDGSASTRIHTSSIFPLSPPPLTLPPPAQSMKLRSSGTENAVNSLNLASSSSSSLYHHHLLTSTTRHGYVAIIRNSQFTDPKLPQLIGYEVDEDRLLSTFLHSLHCDVETHLNITGAEMQRVFKSLSSKDYSSYDYMIIFILTHGVDSNTIYAADGAHLPMNEIFFQFRGDECPSLAGKPKLFFVQACRGNCVDYSASQGSGIPQLTKDPPPASNNVNTNLPPPTSSTTTAPPAPAPTVTVATVHSVPTPPAAPPPITIHKSAICGSLPLGQMDAPNESDFLYASSCVPGYISWTNTASGSWYITALCNVLLSYFPKMHLGDILLRVNYAVSKQNKFVEKYGSVYQIPSPAFTLTRKLYFFRTATRFNLTNPFAIHQLNLDHCPTARLPNDSLTTNDRDKTDTVPGSTMHSTA